MAVSRDQMGVSRYYSAVESMLEGTDIRLNGPNPWDIRINDELFLQRTLAEGSLGVGESYMDGQWECERLDDMLTRVFRANVDRRLPNAGQLWTALLARLVNPQSPRRSFKVGEQHYDVGDDLYARMLDSRMIYTCGYWRTATTLEEAQEAKLDLVCRKLGLKPGMRVLDIGCGWGGAAQFAAERYGVSVTGVTISKNQAATARERCKGLPVTIQLQDYRSVSGKFDRIYSLGMFEHVGVRNYRTYFETARRLLAPDGLFLLHTIGRNLSRTTNDPWIEKHIFPNSMLPSMAQIAAAAEDLFVTEDWHSFGADYDRTLMQYKRFMASWAQIAPQYGDRFRRMWEFWLLSSAASFRARRSQLWQILLSPEGVVGGCAEVR
jgi:cyclopropane-fatty-acyl-phospholipid synthase